MKQTTAPSAKPVAEGERPLQLRPGIRGPDGKRVPPPPHPKGKPFPKKKLKLGGGNAKEALFRQEIRLRTRAECEKACERIVNWLKDGMIDPNRGNSMLNAVGKVLQSKSDTERLELKVADRELLRRIQELEERAGIVEEAAGIDDRQGKVH